MSGVSTSSSVDRCLDGVSVSSDNCLDGGEAGGECTLDGNAGVGGIMKLSGESPGEEAGEYIGEDGEGLELRLGDGVLGG